MKTILPLILASAILSGCLSGCRGLSYDQADYDDDIRQDGVGFLLGLKEPAAIETDRTEQARKLRALAEATDPETGLVDDETYRRLSE